MDGEKLRLYLLQLRTETYLAFPSNYECGQHDTGRLAEPVPLSPVEIIDTFTSHDNFVVILERPFLVITASKLGKLLDLPTDLNA